MKLTKKFILPTSTNISQSLHTLFSQCRRNISFRQAAVRYRNWFQSKPAEAPYQHVVQIGDPVLRNGAQEIPATLFNTKELSIVTKHMKKVLRNYNAVGLAAPQIGLSYRIIVMEFSAQRMDEFTPEVYKSRQMETIPFTVLINPTIHVKDYTKVTFPEACESIKGYAADVPRYLKVKCIAFKETGEKCSYEFQGWPARIIQHEIDHLDGRLYTDLMDRKSFMCTCWQAVNARQGRIKLPFSPK